MPEHAGRNDHLHGLFKDFADALADGGHPSDLVSPELLARIAQTNRALLQRYQGVLAQHGDESLVQQQQELMKATMLCWLDMAKAFRTYRESMVGAQLMLDEGKLREADAMAYQSMLTAAKALVKTQWLDVANDAGTLVSEFGKRFAGIQKSTADMGPTKGEQDDG